MLRSCGVSSQSAHMSSYGSSLSSSVGATNSAAGNTLFVSSSVGANNSAAGKYFICILLNQS